MRAGLIACALLLLLPTAALAEWQLKPFLGATFGGSTTFVLQGQPSGKPNWVIGGGAMLLGGIFGVEGDLGYSPGFFQGPHQELVIDSSVATLTGNLVISLPRRWTQYTLRPYIVGGAGVMRVNIDDVLGLLPVNKSLGTIDVGGGVTGFITNRVGLNWDLRYYRTLGGDIEGLSIGTEQVSFWRATMGLSFRPGHTSGKPRR